MADVTPHLVDIGVNLCHRDFSSDRTEVIDRAVEAGVTVQIITGTSIKSSKQGELLARTRPGVLYFTAGVHPHDASSCNERTVDELRALLKSPFCVSVGECGLDFNRNFSAQETQVRWFEEQVALACELQRPIFVHEREAGDALLGVLDKFTGRLPPLVVHCFTSEADQAAQYLERGFYIGLTGTVCKERRGAPLRKMLESGVVPLERLMLETDAPFMHPAERGRQRCEPHHCVNVARTIAECLGVTFEEVARVTTMNATAFFGLDKAFEATKHLAPASIPSGIDRAPRPHGGRGGRGGRGDGGGRGGHDGRGGGRAGRGGRGGGGRQGGQEGHEGGGRERGGRGGGGRGRGAETERDTASPASGPAPLSVREAAPAPVAPRGGGGGGWARGAGGRVIPGMPPPGHWGAKR